MMSDIPPIVLLVDPDREMLDAYSRELEHAGMWVAGTATYDELIASAEDLHPDVIIADTDGDGDGDALQTLRAMRRHSELSTTPLVVLVPQRAESTPDADVALRKPVPPEFLLRRTREILVRAGAARGRSTVIGKQTRSLVQRSNHLLSKAAMIASAIDDARRECPKCSAELDWVERGTIGGVSYDYYRWCSKGCGLYCFNRNTGTWIRLA